MDISDKELKQLAELTIEKNTVNKNVAEFVLTKLSKKELKRYISFLKFFFNKNRVYVTISDVSSSNFVKKINEAFEGKDVVLLEDKALGAGFKVQMGDTIIDMSLKNYLEETVDLLKNTI